MSSAASSSRRSQVERREATRTRLLDAAFEIVAEHGVNAVTTSEVGRRAGYSRGIVNANIGTREALMIALAETAQTRFVPRSDGRTGRERTLQAVEGYLDMIVDDAAELRVFLRLWSAAFGGEEPAIRPALVRRDRFFRDYFEAELTAGIVDGSTRDDVDAAAVALAIVGLLRGVGMQVDLDGELEPDTARVAVRKLVGLWISTPGEFDGEL